MSDPKGCTMEALAPEAPEPEPVAPVLTREAILARRNSGVERVYVERWKGHVCLRVMSGEDRDAFEQFCTDARTAGRLQVRGILAMLLVRTICDESGQRVFTDEDVDAVNQLDAAVVCELFERAQRLSGLTDDDVEELAGNSPGGQSADSGSA